MAVSALSLISEKLSLSNKPGSIAPCRQGNVFSLGLSPLSVCLIISFSYYPSPYFSPSPRCHFLQPFPLGAPSLAISSSVCLIYLLSFSFSSSLFAGHTHTQAHTHTHAGTRLSVKLGHKKLNTASQCWSSRSAASCPLTSDRHDD